MNYIRHINFMSIVKKTTRIYRINHMFEDSRGLIWLSTQGGGLVCLSPVGDRDWEVYGWYSKKNNKFPTAYLSLVAEAPKGVFSYSLIGGFVSGFSLFLLT